MAKTKKLEEREEYDTGRKQFVDVIDNEHKIEPSDEEKYLGDIITTDGKNVRNIAHKLCLPWTLLFRGCSPLQILFAVKQHSYKL